MDIIVAFPSATRRMIIESERLPVHLGPGIGADEQVVRAGPAPVAQRRTDLDPLDLVEPGTGPEPRADTDGDDDEHQREQRDQRDLRLAALALRSIGAQGRIDRLVLPPDLDRVDDLLADHADHDADDEPDDERHRTGPESGPNTCWEIRVAVSSSSRWVPGSGPGPAGVSST